LLSPGGEHCHAIGFSLHEWGRQRSPLNAIAEDSIHGPDNICRNPNEPQVRRTGAVLCVTERLLSGAGRREQAMTIAERSVNHAE